MAYRDFAYWYDLLNEAADYDSLARRVVATLRENGVDGGIVADLGCGTGELSLRLEKSGYDMICVDASPEMLGMLREKIQERGGGELLLLCQRLEALDLYGTMRAAVCTFDTVNHLSPDQLVAAVARVALFLEPGGLFILDANTPYKHTHVLADHCFELELERHPELTCLWENRYDPQAQATEITIELAEGEQTHFVERFTEYAHPLPFLEQLLGQNGLAVREVLDGERFEPLAPDSQRMWIVAQKLTKEQGENINDE